MVDVGFDLKNRFSGRGVKSKGRKFMQWQTRFSPTYVEPLISQFLTHKGYFRRVLLYLRVLRLRRRVLTLIDVYLFLPSPDVELGWIIQLRTIPELMSNERYTKH